MKLPEQSLSNKHMPIMEAIAIKMPILAHVLPNPSVTRAATVLFASDERIGNGRIGPGVGVGSLLISPEF